MSIPIPNLQLTGGNFQDCEGSVLANGYLLFQLTHDENFTPEGVQVCANPRVVVYLDSTGNVPASPITLVYSNDLMTPAGSMYKIRAFKADGTEAWANPQYFSFPASPDPLDLGTLLPVNP